MTPTPEQASIIQAARGSSDLMVIARAGCAKTTTLTMIVPQLGADTAPPSSVLAVAFNVKIRDELKSRLPESVKVMTLNGLGFTALRSWLRTPMNVDPKKTYNITQSISSSLGVRLSKDEAADLSQLISVAKSRGFVPRGSPLPGKPIIKDTPEGIAEIFDLADVDYREDLEIIFRKCLVEHIKSAFTGTIDFNDQIYLPVVFMAPFPKFHTILVDEAQDLSYLNHLMILRSCTSRLIVVGDPAQAIYGFRGALSNSLEALQAERQFQVLPLNTTFRCAKAIVRRQQDFVPDFSPAASNPEGEVRDLRGSPWNPRSLPGPPPAILCRNNAPLFKLAFRLMRRAIPVTMLGNDIGRALERQLKLATKSLPDGTSRDQTLLSVETHFAKELAKAKTPRREESLNDRLECLRAIVGSTSSLGEARAICHSLFEAKDQAITLGTGHRAKGLEWDTVIHLDPHRIPSPYALGPEALAQEANIKYVIETRAKTTLVLADLDDLELSQ